MPERDREIGNEPELLGAVQYFRTRGSVVAIACGVAVAATLAVSLALPKKYTAVCRLLIEPPGGSDIRITTAVSPVYLESLRTYELFASSDDLFLRAADRFGLRGSKPIDALKKSVLKVEIPRSTKVLEIYATLEDPRKAHELALFLGREVVDLSRSAAIAGERERIAAAELEAREARERFDKAEGEWAETIARTPVDPLSAELDADLALRSRLIRQYVSAESDPADPRAAAIQHETATVNKKIAEEQKELGERTATLARLDSARHSAETELRTARQRAQEARSGAGLGSERLNIIDPGVVPERPSSPKVLLNLLVAASVAFMISVLWLLVRFGWSAPETGRYAAPLAARRD